MSMRGRRAGCRVPQVRILGPGKDRRRSSGHGQTLKLNAPRRNLRKFVLSLLRNPALGAAAKDLGEPDGHLRRDAALAVDQFGESGACDAQGLRRSRDREAERLDALAKNNAAGMRRIFHRHGKTSLVVIEIIDFKRWVPGAPSFSRLLRKGWDTTISSDIRTTYGPKGRLPHRR